MQNLSRTFLTYLPDNVLQALDMFIASQTLHKPLLIRIKAAYEEVLGDVLQMAYDHIQLQQLLSVTLKQGVSTHNPAQLAHAAAAYTAGVALALRFCLLSDLKHPATPACNSYSGTGRCRLQAAQILCQRWWCLQSAPDMSHVASV
jgi:hypothetical protein